MSMLFVSVSNDDFQRRLDVMRQNVFRTDPMFFGSSGNYEISQLHAFVPANEEQLHFYFQKQLHSSEFAVHRCSLPTRWRCCCHN